MNLHDYWRVPIADLEPYHAGRWPRATAEAYHSYQVLRKFINPPGDEDETKWLFSNITSYDCDRVASGRRPFITNQGSMGLDPDSVQRGDLVCIFGGVDTPLIIRAVDGGWRLVGEAYVHGIMDGESVNSSISRTDTDEDFILL